MNSRERFLAIIHGDRPDHPPLFTEGIREEVLLSWNCQGLSTGIDLDNLFQYDQFEQLDPNVYPDPEIIDWSIPEKLLPLLRQRLNPEDPHRLPVDWSELVKGWIIWPNWFPWNGKVLSSSCWTRPCSPVK